MDEQNVEIIKNNKPQKLNKKTKDDLFSNEQKNVTCFC